MLCPYCGSPLQKDVRDYTYYCSQCEKEIIIMDKDGSSSKGTRILNKLMTYIIILFSLALFGMIGYIVYLFLG